MKHIKLYNYHFTGWSKQTKNFDGKLLSKAFDAFFASSPEKATRTFEAILDQSLIDVKLLQVNRSPD